jgi:hypothetical protein
MNIKPESCFHLATALVSAAAPFFLDPIAAGLALAAISIAHAINASLPERRDDGATSER